MDNDSYYYSPQELARPEDVNIVKGTRVGHADRDRTVQHIKQAADNGYLTETEAAARMTHADKAETNAQLRDLTSDLPAPIDTRTWVQRFDWKTPVVLIPVGFALSLMVAIIPSATMNQMKLFPHEPFALGIGIATIVIGVIGFILSLGWLISEID